MEPWDGPALITYANGIKLALVLIKTISVHVDVVRTNDHFYL